MSEKKKCQDIVTRKRKWLTLEKKLAIIKCYEDGASFAKIARENGMNESSVRAIIKKKDKIKDHEMSATSYSSKMITKNRSPVMENMEHLLMIWIEDCNQNRIPLSQMAIQEKAMSLFYKIKENKRNENESATSETFVASRGWFFNFKKRMGLNNVVSESTSTSNDTAAIFLGELKELIEKEGYQDEQIFNVDEISLFWKKMPSQTFLTKMESIQTEYKFSKDRLTLLLGGNASGDFKVKPVLVYRAENPKALRGFSKSTLPVHWRSNKKLCVTQSMFEEWFTACFCPEVEHYCKDNGINFKILLLLDNAMGHSISISDLHENVRVLFVPPNLTSVLQPMDQGVTVTFKAYYLRRIFSQAVEAMKEGAITLVEFLKNYSIKNAIENIYESWFEVPLTCMRGVWQNILPHCSNYFPGSEVYISAVSEEIVELGKDLGFEHATNVFQCIESLSNDTDNETFMELESQVYEKDEDFEDTDVPTTKEFLIDELSTFIQKIEDASGFLMNVDPNLERSIKVRQNLRNVIQCYRDMLEDKKRKRMLHLH